MSEFKIGNYTIESEKYYNTLMDLGITKNEDLAVLDTEKDNKLTEDELVAADLNSEETSENSSEEAESADTDDKNTENGSVTKEEAESNLTESMQAQVQMYIEQIKHLEDQQSRYYNRAGTTTGEIHDRNISKAEGMQSQIDTCRNSLLQLITNYQTQMSNLQNTQNTGTATVGGANGTSDSSGGNYVLGEHNWNFDFTESLSDYNQSELSTIKQTYQENIDKYKAIESATGVPAELICAIHYRESGCDFTTYLHNGDPLGSPTTHVPAGIYFTDWTEAAIDAIKSVGMSVDANSLDSCLDYAERYNGLGYRNRGIASPYVWAGTTKYTGGMYVADGEFSSSARDQRVGVAVIMKALCS